MLPLGIKIGSYTVAQLGHVGPRMDRISVVQGTKSLLKGAEFTQAL